MKNKSGLILPLRALATIIFCLLPFFLPTAKANGGPKSNRPAPLTVRPFRGRYCSAVGPQGWAVIAENPQRVAFGADFMSPDGMVAAGYSIWGGGALTHVPGDETPDRAIAHNLSRGGSLPTQFRNKQQLGPNVYMIEFLNSNGHGVAFWQVIPTGPGGFMLTLRTAQTATTPGLFEKRGAEAMAVARSLHCQVPNVPAAPDPPSLNGTKSKPAGESGEKEPDTLYNQWLDKEYYHDAKTGENYWVSPSHDWVQDGPQGPGYYAPSGNEIVKLNPGYSQ